MGSELGPFSRVPQCHPTQGNQNGSLWVPNWVPSLGFHNVTLHKGPILGPSRVSYFGQPFGSPYGTNWNPPEEPCTSIVFNVSLYYITRSFARSFMFFIFFEKNAFFNILYSYLSHSLHPWQTGFAILAHRNIPIFLMNN